MASAGESNHTFIDRNISARNAVFKTGCLYPGIKRLHLKNLLIIYQEKLESSLTSSNTDFPDAGSEK
jgi:hypothetical protein